MKIESRQRPWDARTKSQGMRYNDTSRYRASEWKGIRASFILGRTWLRNGATGVMEWLSNTLCHTCFLKAGKLVKMHTVDHVKQVIEGGSFTDHANMQSQCVKCHAQKSAREANASKEKRFSIKRKM